nr:BLUF domain-containing protein [Rhizobacter sp. SG703]
MPVPSTTFVYRLLYLSHLAPGRDFSVVAQILHVSRERNQSLGISGVLVFDGARFCQLIEGARPQIVSLAQRIQADPRHTGYRVLFEGEDGSARLLPRWRTGYCEPDALDVFEDDEHLGAGQALSTFMQCVPGWDLVS